VLYVSITIYWRQREMYPLNGDEPHYLIVAQALNSGPALDLAPLYDAARDAGLHSERHTVVRGRALYTHHGLGVPFIIALPSRLWGANGAKLALCCLSGLLVSTFYLVFHAATGSRGWSFAAFLIMAASLPNTMAAGQLYPDLLSGLFRVYLLYLLARGWESARQWPSLLGFALACGLLPWLHHRHWPVAALFTLAFALRLFLALRQGRVAGSAPGADRWLLRPAWLLPPLALTLVLQLLQIGYSLWLFGSITGVGTPRVQGAYTAMILLGLHLDQFHGLFFQNPLLFLGLPGLAIFARRTPPLFALWVAVYVLSWLPIGLAPVGYGNSFAGRYQWDFAPLWVFPLAHFMAWLLRQRGGRILAALVLASASLLQLGYAWRWLTGTVGLFTPWGRPPWAIATFWLELRWHLPWFGTSSQLVDYWPNVSWLVLTILLALGGLRLGADHKGSGLSLALLLPGIALVSVPQPASFPPLDYPGSALFKTTGRDDGQRRLARHGEHAAGALAFGPYVDLPPGCYDVALHYRAAYQREDDTARWDWASQSGATVLAGGLLPAGAEGATLRRQLRVPARKVLSRFEVRVWYPGRGDVSVDRLTITPSPRCRAETPAAAR
jgi:hypothetical protein